MVLLISFFCLSRTPQYSPDHSGKRKTMPENNVHILAG